MVTLLCTVRGCGAPLREETRQFSCARGHSFDIARSGYVNLLQPQDRRSRHPGDTREAVEARRRIGERGFLEPLVKKMIEMSAGSPLLDVGCGDGYHLDAFRQALGSEAHGTDISTPAIDLAARRYRECRFVVANADRFLPCADGSFALVTSITSRVNAGEFRRVLRGDGRLLVALPGADDLIELREAVLGEAKPLERDLHLDGFELLRREDVRHVVEMDAPAIHDVMASSYRGLRRSQQERLAALDFARVTLSRSIYLFAVS